MQLLSLRRLQEEIIVAFQSLRVILNTTQSPQIPIAQLCSPALAMHSLSLHYNLYYDLLLNGIPYRQKPHIGTTRVSPRGFNI